MFHVICIVRSFDVSGAGSECSPSAAAMAVAGIAGVAIAVAVGSTNVVRGAAKYVVAVTAKATLMAPPLIRHAPRSEAAVSRTWRPGATVDVGINGRTAAARGLTAPVAPLLKRREANTDPVGIVYPETTLAGNAASVWQLPLGATSKAR